MPNLHIRDLRFLDWEAVSFQASGGETVGIFGPSGSGKSLLLRAIADLIVCQGERRLDDRPAERMPASAWRRQVALLPSESVWWRETVGEHFDSAPPPERLKFLGFAPEALSWPVERLSTGEKQRLALARGLQHEPRALLLDEPTANLDAESIERAEALLEAYQKENACPLVWVTHDRAQLTRRADRLFEMRDKRLRPANDHD